MNLYEDKYKAPVAQIENWRNHNIDWEEIKTGRCGDLTSFISNCNSMWYWDITCDEWLELVETLHEIESNSQVAFIGNPKVSLLKVPSNPASAWQRYKSVLIHNGFSDLSITQIEKATQKVVSQLTLETQQDNPTRGMVVGNVQSGKTANMAGVIAMAADYGYNFFIVLTGTIDNLRKQTQERLVSDLGSSGSLTFVPLPPLSGKTESGSMLQYLHLDEGDNARYLYVCLKNSSRLDDLLTWINSCNPKKKQLKVLILDDEADQAGVNTANMAKDLVSRINNQIKALTFGRMKKNGKYDENAAPYGAVNYIGYTATPYANFLNEAKDSSLYPTNFILTLHTPEEYIGPQQIFGIEDENRGLPIVNTIETEEIDDVEDGLISNISNPTNLHKAVAWFLCTVACFRHWDMKQPVSMLVHTSQSVNKHIVVADMVKNIIHELKGDLGIDFIRKVYKQQTSMLNEKRFREEVKNFPKKLAIKSYPNFDMLLPYIKELIKLQTTHIELNEEESRLEYNRGIHLCIDNCKNNKVTEENMVFRLIYPDKERNKDIIKTCPAFIVVGGSTLSRGLTLKGLTTTYFIRTTEQADTLMQMGRWFGYRKDYELLPRLWISELVYKQFQFLTVLDSDLREELQNMESMGLSPKDYGPRLDTFPNFKMLKITSSNKSQNSIPIEKDYANKRGQTTIFSDDERIIETNYNRTVEYINSLGKVDRRKVDSLDNPYSKGNGLIWFNQSYVNVLNYVCSLEFPPKVNEKALIKDKEEVLKWFKTQIENDYLTNFNVIVSTNIKSGTILKLKHVEIKLPSRRKLKNKLGESGINLKILTDPNDRLMDIDMSNLSSIDRDEIINSHQLKPTEKRIKYNLANTPCLIIYIVDKNSGKDEEADGDRLPLNLNQHLVGYHIYIPYGNNGKSKSKAFDCGKITVKLDFLRSSDSDADENED